LPVAGEAAVKVRMWIITAPEVEAGIIITRVKRRKMSQMELDPYSRAESVAPVLIMEVRA
jgi:hypothetical protein